MTYSVCSPACVGYGTLHRVSAPSSNINTIVHRTKVERRRKVISCCSHLVAIEQWLYNYGDVVHISCVYTGEWVNNHKSKASWLCTNHKSKDRWLRDVTDNTGNKCNTWCHVNIHTFSCASCRLSWYSLVSFTLSILLHILRAEGRSRGLSLKHSSARERSGWERPTFVSP